MMETNHASSSSRNDILKENSVHAAHNREQFRRRGILALNLMPGTGSGKTTLLVRTLRDLKERFHLGVVEGDQQTSHDTEAIHNTGVRAVQVNTVKGCHLDAFTVGHALEKLPMEDGGVLFIENVGNLVCTASFDLGEAHKVVILSVTEGEEKPLKYPDIFHAANLVLLNKIDLLPHLSFNLEHCMESIRRVNPYCEMLQVSATTREGMDSGYHWIDDQCVEQTVQVI